MESEALVQTPSGPIKGIAGPQISKFLGIRYAEPSIGKNRFRPPQPISAQTEPIDATRYGNRNLQVGMAEIIYGDFVPPGDESEDCLFLNIFAPNAFQQPKPVMVWIHGGAFCSGSGNEYDPTQLVQDNDVVVVTINYRLGVFGFLNLQRLGPGYEESINLGIQDQIAALQWVQDNIAAFGGDPSNVIIWGESAGGTSVFALPGCPSAKGLFHKCAPFSGAETLSPPLDQIDAIKAYLGVSTDDECRDKLTSMEAKELSTMQQNIPFFPGPCVDGTVITHPTCEAIKEGLASSIPFVTGTVRDEGTLLAPLFAISEEATQMTIVALAASISRDMGQGYSEYLAKEYAESSSLDRLTRAWFDLFRSSAVRVASVATQHGAGGWIYNFEVESDHELGITHFADVPFAFDWIKEGYPLSFVHKGTDENRKLAKAWSRTLVAFATTGDPNGEGLPDWPKYKPEAYECLRISHNPEVISNPDAELLSVYGVE